MSATRPTQRWFPTGPAPDVPPPAPIDAQPADQAPVAPPPRRAPLGRWFLGLAAAAFVAVIAVDLGTTVATLLASSPILGVGLGTLALAAAALGIACVFREWRALARLRGFESSRAEAERLARSDDFSGRAEDFLRRLRSRLPARPEVARALARFDRMSLHGDTDAEALAKFSRAVLLPLDTEARRMVRHAAGVAAVGTSIMPSPAFDAVFALWRGLRLVRALADLYGVAPGPVVTLALARHLLTTASTGAAFEIAGQGIAEQLGLGVAERFGANLAEGLFVGLRIARLGLIAMRHCRPLPFAEDEAPRLRDLLGELLRPKE